MKDGKVQKHSYDNDFSTDEQDKEEFYAVKNTSAKISYNNGEVWQSEGDKDDISEVLKQAEKDDEEYRDK